MKTGLWWKDVPNVKHTSTRARPMPPLPQTGWTPPAYFPTLSGARALSIDTETYDPDLEKSGPGWARGRGHIVGVSVGAIDELNNIGKWYFPMRHETDTHMNLCPEHVLNWLRDTLSDDRQPKIGANLQYDIGWLRQESVDVRGSLMDVQFAEALLDEAAPVALEKLGQKYLGEGKDSNLMYEGLSAWFGGAPTGKQRKWIYKAPPQLVGAYAESDADRPLRLAMTMWPKMADENLLRVFDMENRLIRLMIDMRFAGVTVDIDKAVQLRETLIVKQASLSKQLRSAVGFDVNVYASDSLAKAFDTCGLKYNLTATGKPSFTKDFVKGVEHPIADLINEIKKVDKLRSTFIESYMLDSHIDGKVYGQFHQLRGEGGGTRSGRYSSSTPNLQNIPSRDKELAPLIRGLFIPDEGHNQWVKGDYSQIEYRMLLDCAEGQAGDDIRAYFMRNPDTDYHDYAQSLVKKSTGRLIDRGPIKNINFGLIYGVGVKKLAGMINMPEDETRIIMDAYFKGVPFAKPTMDAAMNEALETGVIHTILGRKSRFDLWEPKRWDADTYPLPYDDAISTYGSEIRRAGTHKALNRKLQGGAADLMKAAMLKAYEDGVFDVTGVPRLTVHDELDFSDAGGNEEAFKELKHIMETAIEEIRVPIKFEMEHGPDWGHVSDWALG